MVSQPIGRGHHSGVMAASRGVAVLFRAAAHTADISTGLPQALGLFVSLPFRRAIARLVPSVCGTVPPREGGPHVRLRHRIVHHAMVKQLPLS